MLGFEKFLDYQQELGNPQIDLVYTKLYVSSKYVL